MLYRIVSGVVTFLMAFGVLDAHLSALWTQTAIATITLLFAVIHSDSGWRVALYLLTGPLGALVMAYGILNDEQAALITAGVAQIFGITTAAAKAQLPEAP